jgi:DNA segregation ATPase FtsK/SpoIIIE-like protein
MLADHPEYAELFDYVARKGRLFRIHILFASQTLMSGRSRTSTRTPPTGSV